MQIHCMRIQCFSRLYNWLHVHVDCMPSEHVQCMSNIYCGNGHNSCVHVSYRTCYTKNSHRHTCTLCTCTCTSVSLSLLLWVLPYSVHVHTLQHLTFRYCIISAQIHVTCLMNTTHVHVYVNSDEVHVYTYMMYSKSLHTHVHMYLYT